MFICQTHGLRFLGPAQRVIRTTRLCLPTLVLVFFSPASALADSSPPLSTTAGFEYYAGPDNQLTRTATGELEAKLRGGSASISVGRIDDAGAGVGLHLGASLGLPIAPRTELNLVAERAQGDSGYTAWTLNAGPAFQVLRGRTLSLKYVRIKDNESTVTNGASAELESPVIPDHLNASAVLSYTKMQDLGGVEGSAGLSWTPVEHFEIEGDAGYTQTGLSLSNPFSSKHVAKSSQKLGRKKTTSSGLEESPGMITQVAVRFSFP